jgi:hypothetical protein
LAAGAEAHRREPSPFLRARILARLEAEPTPQAPSLLLSRWIRAALIPAVGIVLIAAYSLRKNADLPRSFPAVDVVQETSEVPYAAPSTEADLLLAWTERLDQPLATELNSVVSDAKMAWESLTDNFMPSQFLAKNEF